MARRKKHPKLPNGFGSIKYLGKGRYRPYGVYPPVTEYTVKGPVTPKAIAYVETWEEGYELLTTLKMENEGKIKVQTGVYIDRTPLFKEVYEDFYKEKYRNEIAENKKTASMNSTQAAFKNSATLHNMRFGQIRYKDMQDVLNACTLKHSSMELIASLLHQLYKYAMKYDIVDKDYSAALFIPIPDDDESGVPFSAEELKILWNNKSDQTVQMILIMCYSGYRIKAFENIEINLEDKYFKGGVKTKAGKGRIVPIHPAIYDMVCSRYSENNLIGCSASEFRKRMYKVLSGLGIANAPTGEKHTPHDCRHTFSYLCEHFSVNENDRKRMMGHSFGSDITNSKYGHRTLEELRQEIEKIKTPLRSQ
jgi:integrase